jgi:hypothetical protein
MQCDRMQARVEQYLGQVARSRVISQNCPHIVAQYLKLDSQ